MKIVKHDKPPRTLGQEIADVKRYRGKKFTVYRDYLNDDLLYVFWDATYRVSMRTITDDVLTLREKDTA